MKKSFLFILGIILGYLACPQASPNPAVDTLAQARGWLLTAKTSREKGNTAPAKAAALRALALLKNYRTPDLANAEMEAANYYSYSDNQGNKQRVALYRDAALLYEQAGWKLQQGNALEMLGDLLQVQNRTINEALPPLLQAFRLYRAVHMDNVGNLCTLLASVYSRMGDHHAALVYGLIAVEQENAKTHPCRSLGTAYNRLGIVYYNMPDYTRADTAFILALAAARRFHDTDGIKDIASNLIYTKLKLHQTDSATVILDDLSQHFPFTNPEDRAILQQLRLRLFLALHRTRLAAPVVPQLTRFESAKTGDYNTHDLIATALFDYAIAIKDYPLARQYALTRQNLCRDNPYSPALYKSYYQLYEADSAEGRYQAAMINYRHYVALRDSMQKETANNQLTTLELQSNSNVNPVVIPQKTIDTNHRPAWSWIITAAILLICAPLLYNRYRISRRNRQLQKEKDWLLNELHHRVKNNLQIVISLLSTQSSYLDNETKAQAAIGQSRNRMYALSLIHQRLYQNDNLEWVDMTRYLPDLVEYLRDSFPKQRHILFHFDIDPKPLEVSIAIPIGLILNEAITNALQYAFPDKRQGNIHIRLRQTQGLQVDITDNGIGLAPDFNSHPRHSMGIELMETLVQQLEGKMKITSENGTHISIHIPPFAETET